jgi:transposase-like protein
MKKSVNGSWLILFAAILWGTTGTSQAFAPEVFDSTTIGTLRLGILRRNWERLTPLFSYPPAIRKAIYTTNAIESVNMSLRKVTKNRGSFPNDEPMIKLLYLALQNIEKKWTMPIRNWKSALNQFTIIFEDRMPTY